MKKYLLAFTFIISTLATEAQDGSLDRSFAHKGWTSIDLPEFDLGSAYTYDVFVQKDGKPVIVFQGNFYCILARYMPNGNKDLSYGKKGFSDPAELETYDAEIQTDGKILIIGKYVIVDNPDSVTYTSALVRFDCDGSLDRSFGKNGIQALPFEFPTNSKMAIQRDGKIVVTGSYEWNETGFILARFNSNGKPDTGFGNAGVVKGNELLSSAIVIRTNGKIIVGGSNNGAFVMRGFLPDGNQDNGFGDGGLVITNLPGFSSLKVLAIQYDGKIVASGEMHNSAGTDFVMTRYLLNGTLDKNFGIVTRNFNADDFLTDMAIGKDGKILLAGYSSVSTGTDLALARFNSNGSIDFDFNNTGYVITNIDLYDKVKSVAIDHKTGDIVAGGDVSNNNIRDYALIRYTKDGTLDADFDQDGKLVGYYPMHLGSRLNTIAVQYDKKIVAAGNIFRPGYTGSNFLMVRLLPNGSGDHSFGINGIVEHDFGPYAFVELMELQKNGKILATIRIFNLSQTDSWVILVRFNTNGSLDSSFGNNGVLNIPYKEVSTIIIQHNKILISASSAGNLIIARYNENGTPDSHFGTAGILTCFLGTDVNPAKLAIQDDGKYVVTGSIGNFDNSTIFVSRIKQNGNLDSSFGINGKLNINRGYFAFGKFVSIQKDGKILVAGTVYNKFFKQNYHSDFILFRFLPNGMTDVNFGINGEATANLLAVDEPHSMNIQRDGKIILVGEAGFGFEASDFALVRFRTDGRLDNSFGDNGKVRTHISNFNLAYGADWFDDHLYVAGVGYFAIGMTGVIAVYKANSSGNHYVHGTSEDLNNVKLKEEKQESKLFVKLYPNPSTDIFKISLQGGNNLPVQITIMDEAGRIIQKLENVENHSNLQLGKNFRPGIYLVEIIQGKEKVSLKLVKQS